MSAQEILPKHICGLEYLLAKTPPAATPTSRGGPAGLHRIALPRLLLQGRLRVATRRGRWPGFAGTLVAPGSSRRRRLGSDPGAVSPDAPGEPSPGTRRPHGLTQPRGAARQERPCAPRGASTSFQRSAAPSPESPVALHSRSRNTAFPGSALSSPRPFPHSPLLPGSLQDPPAQERKKRPLTASLHFPPRPPSSLLLSLRPGGPGPAARRRRDLTGGT